MGLTKLLLDGLLVLAASSVDVRPAAAQCQLCGGGSNVEAADEVPLRIEIGAALDFDRLTANGPGAVAIDPVNRGRIASGGLTGMGGLFTAGSVTVRGGANRRIVVVLPASVAMRTAGGGTATIRELTTDLGRNPRLGKDGTLRFAFGGRLDVPGGVDGDLRGNVAITVDYQ